MNAPATIAADTSRPSRPWHLTGPGKSAIAAVVLANEQATRHQQAYVLTTDEFYTYEGPLAAKVVEVWTNAFTAADRAYRAGDLGALTAWANSPRPDAAIDAAYGKRAL